MTRQLNGLERSQCGYIMIKFGQMVLKGWVDNTINQVNCCLERSNRVHNDKTGSNGLEITDSIGYTMIKFGQMGVKG